VPKGHGTLPRVRPKTPLSIKLSGGDVSLSTVDPLAFLQLAASCLRLTMKVAEAGGLGLTFRGIALKPGSAVMVSTPSDAGSARLAVGRAMRIVRGDEDAPRGTETAVDDLRAMARALPATVSASLNVGTWTRSLRAPPLSKDDDRPWERTELRVKPIRVGGGGLEPTARLVSTSEPLPFVVALSEDDARKLGGFLYLDVDVELELCRDANGHIEKGRVTKIIPLTAVEPLVAWRAWFSENAAGWEDVGEALGRYN
jgi:hypothetical protein